MLKWLAKLLGIDMRSKYQRGYDYVMNSYSQDPTTQTLERLQHENDNECFNYDDFNRGMQKALDNLDAFDSITNPDRF